MPYRPSGGRAYGAYRQKSASGAASSLITNLQGYWKLDEASGTRMDQTTNANNLTDNNTVTQGAGKVNFSGQFTAANSEYLSIASNATLELAAAPYTLAAWFNMDTIASHEQIISKTGGAGDDWYLYYHNGLDRVVFFNGVGQVVTNNFGAMSAATWYFVVAWQSGGALNISINDVAEDPSSAAAGTASNSPFYLGSYRGSSEFMDGRIDEAGIWSRALTAGERTTLYNAGNGTTYPF